MIDDLKYDYEGNQLKNVTDRTNDPAGFNDGNNHQQANLNDFEYDDYGNLIIDRNKGIHEITYNHLNLPKKIVFETGEITYLYDATGVKLKKTVTDGNTSQITNTHYSGGFQYTEDHLDFFPHAEGYVNVIDYSAFNYVYTYKDHLGNIRLKYTLDPDTNETAILEENHYYPFGLTHQGYNADHKFFFVAIDEIIELVEVTSNRDDKYKYKYQGQERQDELGLNWDSFKWRNYDYAIGRFMSIDPLAEKYVYNSPYAFQENKIGLGRELEGLELVYREGTSPEFKKKFGSTVQYMNEKRTSKMMAQLNNSGKTEIVDNTGKGSFYNPKEEAIYWDSTGGVETSEGHLLSPATVLNHEIDHALQHKINTEEFKNDIDPIKGYDPHYDNKEEKRVITGSEQTTAKSHGEIGENEVTRKDHGGSQMNMPDPTSTENATPRPTELEEVIIRNRN